MDKNSTKWYQKTQWIIVLLILFFPLGLLLMWTSAKWNKGVKWVITGLFALFFVMGAISNNSNKSASQTAVAHTSPVSPTNTSIPSPKAHRRLKKRLRHFLVMEKARRSLTRMI